jgi:mevalonate kinase
VVEIKAPAKIILFGEHFIVNKGSQAVLSSVGLYTNCKIQDSKDARYRIRFSSSSFNIEIDFTKTEARDIYSIANKLHDQYLKSTSIQDLKKFIQKQGNFFKALIGYLNENYSMRPSQIEFNCDAPLGSGMGTSASIAASMILALFKFINLNLTSQKLFDLTKAIEDLQHGSSSGADPAAIIKGGLLHYEHNRKGDKEFHRISKNSDWTKHLFLINTGSPLESTGEMVSIVGDFKNKNPKRFDTLLQRSNEICNKFISNQAPNMIELLNASGIMLEEIGVVSDKVIDFSNLIRQNSGAIKIAGAGGRKGQSSGICLVVFKDNQKLNKICSEYDFKLLNAPLMVAGIKD